MSKQLGFSLIETLVAMAILGIVSVGFLGALTTSSRASVATDRMDTGRAIAQAQIEWVKSQTFLTSQQYTPNQIIMAQYPGYSVSITARTATERDAFIQTVTVSVTYAGQEVARLQDCKVKK